jgi:FKBP-type peptidyl-prolyl cis-trans isomerase
MKRTALISSLILLFILVLPACKEDVYMDWKLQNELWMKNLVETHKKDSNFFTTPSGLSYKVIHQGWEYNRKPNVNSVVNVNYTGSLVDGSVFETGSGVSKSLAGAVKGWKEAIPKMNDGGTYILYIPSTLGYDTVSTDVKIPPYSTLIFEVDLIYSYN